MKKHGLASEKSSSGATPKSSSHSNSIRDSSADGYCVCCS